MAPSARAPVIRPGVTSMIRALPWVESVITPAWDPVNERASRPRLAMAMASSAIEMRSPAVSSMSSSRPGGTGLTWLARAYRSSVVSPIAGTATTTEWPALRVATMRWATRLIPSASATEDPPYFWTTRATAGSPPPGSDSGTWQRSRPSCADGGQDESTRGMRAATGPPGASGRLAGRRHPLGHVQAGVGHHRMQRTQRRPAVRAPVVHVGKLPPPQRLGGPAGLVVLEPVDQVGRHRGQVIGQPEPGRAGVGRIRVEDLGVVVAGQPRGQPGTQRVQVRIGPYVGLPVADRD